MQVPPSISFRGMDTSPALEARILERIKQLEQYHPRITSCQVIVDVPHHHKHKGNLYSVNIEFVVPGHTINVSREAGMNHAHEDMHVLIRDSFNEAERQLEDHVRKRSPHRTRQPQVPMQGKVAKIFLEDGYGFIDALDGREIYFRLDQIAKGHEDAIDVGTKVHFKIGQSSDGPYAHAITPL